MQNKFDVDGNKSKVAIQLACEHRLISGRRFTSLRKIARYFSEGEKRRPEMRLLFPGYYSTRFAAMLQYKLHDFCCPFFHTWKGHLHSHFTPTTKILQGFCFFMQIRAFIILTSRDLMKGKGVLNSGPSSKKMSSSKRPIHVVIKGNKSVNRSNSPPSNQSARETASELMIHSERQWTIGSLCSPKQL